MNDKICEMREVCSEHREELHRLWFHLNCSLVADNRKPLWKHTTHTRTRRRERERAVTKCLSHIWRILSQNIAGLPENC